MPKIIYVDSEGNERSCEVPLGLSVMEGAVRNEVAGIDGDCGGACVCGTCRVEVPREWADKVGEPSEFEAGLLSGFSDERPNCRLSCQIRVSGSLEGLVVVVAPTKE